MSRTTDAFWTDDDRYLAERIGRQLALVTDDRDWVDVRRRAERPRRAPAGRRTRLVLALAAAAVLAAPALAVTNEIVPWFRGEPAPPAVQASFGKLSENVLPSSISGRVDVAQARGVIAIDSPAGMVRLWAAPTDDGGRCRIIQVGDGEQARDHAFSCSTAGPRSPFWGGLGAFPGDRRYIIVNGGAASNVTEVGVQFADGSRRATPLVDGYFLGVVARADKPTAFYFEHVRGGVTRTSVFHFPSGAPRDE